MKMKDEFMTHFNDFGDFRIRLTTLDQPGAIGINKNTKEEDDDDHG